MKNDFLPYGQHSVDDDDIAAVVDVLKNGALTCGPKIEEFEQAFAKEVGAKQAVVVSNGTTALHLALLAAGFKPGDTAVVPTVTFLSTANAVIMAGGNVQFADVCPDTGLLTVESLKAAVEKAESPVTVVLPVHLTGQACDMQEIKPYADDHDMKIISDCCHALGAEYKSGGRPGDGQFEELACYSLHPVKSIAMGEGGVVTTNSVHQAEHLRLLRSHDMRKQPEQFSVIEQAFDQNGTPNPWYYEMHELAYNYRATDFQCALALSQLKKLPAFMVRRRKLAELYDALFTDMSNVIVPNARMTDCRSAWHLYAVKVNFKALGIERATFMRELMARGIGTQVHYIPVHRQPYYIDRYGQQDLPGADAYYEQTLSLPLFPAMNDNDPERVFLAIQEIIGTP